MRMGEAECPPYDPVLMFKILVIHTLNTLSYGTDGVVAQRASVVHALLWFGVIGSGA